MIYVMNILTSTRLGDAYDMVAINKFPIIYKTGKSPDDFLKDSRIINHINELIKNEATREHAILYVRGIDDNMEFTDTKYSIKKILNQDEIQE